MEPVSLFGSGDDLRDHPGSLHASHTMPFTTPLPLPLMLPLML
jgi:hypothetical protein